MGGINEAGLVIHILMLGETTYPLPDDRPAIKQLQWVQYHLDQFETVDQVIAHQAHIRILTHEKPGIHYLVADRRGDCATVEWLDGKLVVHHQESLPVRVLANNSYADSLARLKTHTGFGGDLPIHGGEASLERFVTASKMLRDFHAKPAPAMVDYAFNVLRSVRQSLFTQWSIVYDLNRLKVHFFTQQHPGIKTVALGDFDLSCTRPVQVLDMSLDAEGDVADRFTRYSEALNYRVLQEALGKSEILGEFPEAHIRRRAAHPESHLCAP
jgi:choloylglycine hydrolase